MISGGSRWWYDAAAVAADLHSRQHIAVLSPLAVCKRVLGRCAQLGLH